MANHIPYNYNQTTMVVINFLDQIQAGTFEHAVHYLVENKLDLSCFDDSFKNDHQGRPSYDPVILLKIILFAYSKGITSSREIEWCCQTNIIFKALSCDTVPHFTSIARFISRQPDAITSLFEQVLLICDEQGLLGHELFAIDGCKLPSNAAKTWSGTHKELAKKRKKIKALIQYHMKKHQELDKLESVETQQSERLLQSIETLEKAAQKIGNFLAENEPRMGKGKQLREVKSNITDNESAKMKTSKGTIQGYNGLASVDKKHQVIVDAQVFGEGQEHHTLQPILKDIDARFKRLGIHEDIFSTNDEETQGGVIVTADTGFANEANMKYLHEACINAYIPDNNFRSRDPKFKAQKQTYPRLTRAKGGKPIHLFPASKFHFDPVLSTCVCPAGESLSPRRHREDNRGVFRAYFVGRLTLCRDCELNEKCLKNPKEGIHNSNCRGRQVSFVLNKKPNYTDWMKHRVDSNKGKMIYSHRMSVVEPVFGNLTVNKKLRRFSLRGKTKVNAQWQLFCLIQNIEKIAHYGGLAA